MEWLIDLKIKLVVKRKIKKYKKYQRKAVENQSEAVKYFKISQEYLRGFEKALEEIKNIQEQQEE